MEGEEAMIQFSQLFTDDKDSLEEVCCPHLSACGDNVMCVCALLQIFRITAEEHGLLKEGASELQVVDALIPEELLIR